MSYFPAIRRLLVVSLLATWWGGFTFYSLAVIPSGHAVLHSELRQGLITQKVTQKLNFLGVATLAVALVEAGAAWPQRKRAMVFISAWLICALAQAALFYFHARLDALLSPGDMSLADEAGFKRLHDWYVSIATVGWLAAAILLAMTVLPGKSLAETNLFRDDAL